MKRSPLFKIAPALVCAAAWLMELGSVAAQEAEMRRDALPVPEVIMMKFKKNGLKVFDAFDSQSFEDAVKPVVPVPVQVASIPAPLTGSEFYDLLPLYARRGFQPAAGTVALFEPESRRLYLKATETDMRVLRELCTWPLEIWKKDVWGDGNANVHEVVLSFSAWIIPATGPGGWNFRPRTPGELLALPDTSRRIAGRQSLLIRGGQRSKVQSFTNSPSYTVSALTTEAEATVLDDGTMDLNFALSYRPVSPDAARLWQTDCTCNIRAGHGQSWLIEGWAIPGKVPARLFIMGRADLRDPFPQGNFTRWTEAQPRKKTDVVCRTAIRDSRVIESKIGKDRTPDQSGLFGGVTAYNVTEAFSKLGLFSNRAEFFGCQDTTYLFFRGPAEDALKFDQWYRQLIFNPALECHVEAHALLTSKPETALPGDGEAEIIGRAFFPGRAGNQSLVNLRSGAVAIPERDQDGFPVTLGLTTSHTWLDEQPATPGKSRWTLGAVTTVAPPLATAEKNVGDPHKSDFAVPLRQIVGTAPDGRKIVVIANTLPASPLPPTKPTPLDEWWERAAGIR